MAAQEQDEWLARTYQLRGHEQLAAFLRKHPFLLDLLAEAPGQIGQHFGPEVQLALEVFSDPEAEDEEEAFILILTDLPPEQARSRLDQLDEEWWLDASQAAGGLLNIDVEYLSWGLTGHGT